MKGKSSRRLPLIVKIIIAIMLGIGAGWLWSPAWTDMPVRLFTTFNGLFSQYLSFVVPLLIIAFVAPAIAELGSRAGKMLLFTAALAYVFTFMSGAISYFTSVSFFPSMIDADLYIAAESSAVDFAPYFTMDIVPVVGVLSALVLAFLLGLGAANTASTTLRNALDEFRDVVGWLIRKSIIPVLPLYIFGIFLEMTASGKVGPLLSTFLNIILVIFALHIFILVLQYCIAALFSRTNPLKSLWTMLPAYFTALGTSSSAATIPVTLKRSFKLGVDRDVASFTIPLCATIHMSGSTLKIVACALALMVMKGMPYDTGMFMAFIAMIGISIIAAPGVPGGAIMASLGLLSSILGFTDEDNALMIALYISMDSFGTACNVAGDGAVTLIVNRFFGKKNGSATSEAEVGEHCGTIA